MVCLPSARGMLGYSLVLDGLGGSSSRLCHTSQVTPSLLALRLWAGLMVLSEKAKGKQRAVDTEPSSPQESRNLTIRFTEGVPDLALDVTDSDTVRQVKAKV